MKAGSIPTVPTRNLEYNESADTGACGRVWKHRDSSHACAKSTGPSEARRVHQVDFSVPSFAFDTHAKVKRSASISRSLKAANKVVTQHMANKLGARYSLIA
jgi:hypothetical protein